MAQNDLHVLKHTYTHTRCPIEITPSMEASPKVMANKLLGGVDQATLRQSLSRLGDQNPVTEYLSDSDVWLFTETVKHLEALQLDMITSDLQVNNLPSLSLSHTHTHTHTITHTQEVIMDVNLARQLLKDILLAPQDGSLRYF